MKISDIKEVSEALEYKFIDEIAEKLKAAGLDDEKINECRSALTERYHSLSDDELEGALEKDGGVEGITADILNSLKSGKSEEKLNIISIDDDMFSDSAEDEAPDPERDVESVVSQIENGDDKAPSVTVENFFDNDDDIKVKRPKTGDVSAKKNTTTKQRPSEKANQQQKKKTSVKNMSTKAKTTYIIGLVFLIPLLIILVMAITVLFLALYAAIILLVVLFSVALVVIAAVGTALSLMAIVYGVIQLVQGVPAPIGIYEMGLGIVVGGITLGVSILLYNFIVRLAPFLFKKMFVLYKFLFRQLTKLLGFVKGVCSKL